MGKAREERLYIKFKRERELDRFFLETQDFKKPENRRIDSGSLCFLALMLVAFLRPASHRFIVLLLSVFYESACNRDWIRMSG